MDILLQIIKPFLLGYIISRFEPIQWIFNLFKDTIIKTIIEYLLTCSKCLTFWSSIILFGDIYMAIGSYILMMLYEKSIGVWENKIKLN